MATETGRAVEHSFLKLFNVQPEWVVRCPGRVNLIGEHIDYSDYGVCPMAIEQSTYLAIGHAADECIHLESIDSSKYPSFNKNAIAAITEALPFTCEWHHYFLAGWKGMWQHLQSNQKPAGINVVIGSSIPPSAGLSSSSALVCASALATYLIDTNPKTSQEIFEQLTRKQLAEIATAAERFVGTEGGGMDQACECLALDGSALRIDFNPLEARPVNLPSAALFAVIHSGLEINKASTTHYNERVVECRLAAQVLCHLGGFTSKADWSSIRTLKQAQKAFCAAHPADMLPHVEKLLSKECYVRSEICDLLGASDSELRVGSLNNNTLEMQRFKLKQRARHVFSEAQRVLEFEAACRNPAGGLKQLADLMNGSHRSCAEDFECSCPELDQTVAQCRKAGCIGARLTGAGWGGCCVALVEKEKKDAVASKLKVLFWTEPSAGIDSARP